ncbi:hypothetical protein [uncultured Desulfobacter sp.]|uniref:hypothetical protein n=1 Tax=uncultured Desulfobacter sp. TaxID=240139 RepID=UPI002AABE8F4|nr:hypothetical protein [uncultured Desulfobacter sp.]
MAQGCPSVKHLVQFTPDPSPGDFLEGAVAITQMMDKKRLVGLKIKDLFFGRLKRSYQDLGPRTPCLIIYITGTIGAPKPAVLCHENIIVQNQILALRFGTGLGMTENAGFGTFTPQGIPIEEMAGQVGQAFEDLARVSIRKPMDRDGAAGDELPDGEVGEICCHPQKKI